MKLQAVIDWSERSEKIFSRIGKNWQEIYCVCRILFWKS